MHFVISNNNNKNVQYIDCVLFKFLMKISQIVTKKNFLYV